jgi:hypothetical protein
MLALGGQLRRRKIRTVGKNENNSKRRGSGIIVLDLMENISLSLP